MKLPLEAGTGGVGISSNLCGRVRSNATYEQDCLDFNNAKPDSPKDSSINSESSKPSVCVFM